MQWPGYDAYNNPPVVVSGRPGRGWPRHGSENPRQTTYFTDANGMLIPQAGLGFGRANSVSGGRPAQIVINNTQWDEHSPPNTSRSRRNSGYTDDSWDERAHSPRRHRDSSRDRSRNRSRDRSKHRSHSHERRRHSHSHNQVRDSRSPSPYLDYETQQRMKKLEEFERKEEEEAARERAKQEMIIAEAKKAAKKKEEEELKKRLVAEAEREKYEKEMKEREKKEDEDRVFTARLTDMYIAQGYSEESIKIMIQDAENKKRHGSHGSHSPHSPLAVGGHYDNTIVKIEDHMKVVDLNRPTYIKVHRKHLSPETLDAYSLPWEWYEGDTNYIVIKKWVNQNVQDKLFEHTRRLREQRLLTTNTTVELKKEHGKLKLVRERSPHRERSRSRPRSFLFT
ncbi:MAG: hypothetical protein LQ352_001295 [Teloschistes flavicans]|nr:MAG: hypothetical protein LQ352_001295 [Teloschistes flavicans]